MTKNFDSLLKTCLNEMQAQPDPSKDVLLQSVVANKDHPVLRKAIEDALKKIQQEQPKPATPPQTPAPQQNQAQTKPATPQQAQTPGQQNPQQQPNNNAANKPV